MSAILVAVYVITAINVLTSSGFAIAGVARPDLIAPGPSTEASRTFAWYAAARAIPIAIIALVAIALGARGVVLWLGLLAGIVQLVDAWIGWRQHDLGKTMGPLLIAVLQLGALWLLHSYG